MLRAHGVTDKGPTRLINEDCFAIDDRLRLAVVADGMGGHRAGEIAARVAVETILQSVSNEEETPAWAFGFDPALSSVGNLLRTAVHAANLRVLEASAADDEYDGMGTTVVAAMVRGDRLSVAHVGDSRLYLFAEGSLRQVTHDDSWVASVLAHDPTADPDTLRHHPMRHALTNVVGRRPPADVHVTEEILRGGAWLALTTDGVHGTLDNNWIGRLLEKGREAEDIAARLINEALAHGSRDNCTAVVARYEPDEG